MYSRHRDRGILAAVLFAQILLLAYQVRRDRDVPLIRQGTILLVSPVQKGFRAISNGAVGLWRGYVSLWGARQESQELARELDALKLENQRLHNEAERARRLQVLFDFKQENPWDVVAAQVISSEAGEASQSLLLDKGRNAGFRPDMPVIAPDGIVGKILHVFPTAAQVLLITDANSGVAGLLESSRIHGILKGQSGPLGRLDYVANGEKVEIGERLVTSGEDRIYPKGLPVGVIVEARPGATFQEIRVQPFARLNRLEEVLVIVRKPEPEPAASPATPGDVEEFPKAATESAPGLAVPARPAERAPAPPPASPPKAAGNPPERLASPSLSPLPEAQAATPPGPAP